MPASYRTAKHGVKSVEDLVKQIQPYLGDKKDAVLKVLAGSTDTAELVPLYPKQKGADTQVSPPVAEKPQIAEAKAPPAPEKPSEQPQTPQPQLQLHTAHS